MASTDTKAKKTGMSDDRRNIWLLIVTTLLIVGSIILFMPPQEKINQGLDIQGGLSVVLTASSTDGDAITEEDMEKVRDAVSKASLIRWAGREETMNLKFRKRKDGREVGYSLQTIRTRESDEHHIVLGVRPEG